MLSYIFFKSPRPVIRNPEGCVPPSFGYATWLQSLVLRGAGDGIEVFNFILMLWYLPGFRTPAIYTLKIGLIYGWYRDWSQINHLFDAVGVWNWKVCLLGWKNWRTWNASCFTWLNCTFKWNRFERRAQDTIDANCEPWMGKKRNIVTIRYIFMRFIWNKKYWFIVKYLFKNSLISILYYKIINF